MKKSLTLDQTRRLLALTAGSDTNRGNPENRALFLAVILCGAKARTWTWKKANRKQPTGSSVATPFLAASVKVERDPRLHGLNRRSSIRTR